jgi:hypothetical protein
MRIRRGVAGHPGAVEVGGEFVESAFFFGGCVLVAGAVSGAAGARGAEGRVALGPAGEGPELPGGAAREEDGAGSAERRFGCAHAEWGEEWFLSEEVGAAGFGEGCEGGKFGIGAGVAGAAALFGAQAGELAPDMRLLGPCEVVIEVDVVVEGDLDGGEVAAETLDENAADVGVSREGDGRVVMRRALGGRAQGVARVAFVADGVGI